MGDRESGEATSYAQGLGEEEQRRVYSPQTNLHTLIGLATVDHFSWENAKPFSFSQIEHYEKEIKRPKNFLPMITCIERRPHLNPYSLPLQFPRRKLGTNRKFSKDTAFSHVKIRVLLVPEHFSEFFS